MKHTVFNDFNILDFGAFYFLGVERNTLSFEKATRAKTKLKA